MSKEIESHRFLEFAYQLYKTMKTNEINLVYEGEVTQEITKTFTSLTEKNMARSEEPNQVQRKVFNVMVECLQNISKHADTLSDEADDDRRGIVMVSKGDDSYKIITGNVIRNSKVPGLKESLEHINSLDKAGLSSLYKQQIVEAKLSEKGGAGLDLLISLKKPAVNCHTSLKN
jgi:hypothetical protein